RLAHLLAPDHRREADGEGVDAHPEQPGEEEVPELVDEDEDAQGEGDPEEVREDVEDGVHAGGVRGKAERTGKLRAAVPGGQTFHGVEGAGREEGMEGNASLYPPSPPLPPPSPSPTPRPARAPPPVRRRRRRGGCRGRRPGRRRRGRGRPR